LRLFVVMLCLVFWPQVLQLLLRLVLRPPLLLRLILHGNQFLQCRIHWELRDAAGGGRGETPRNLFQGRCSVCGVHEQPRPQYPLRLV
jgi:hypothetical protein